MNCATTCNTGSCRGFRGSPGGRSACHKTSRIEPHFEETGQIWTEAGFVPSQDCQRVVALLHRLAMDEDPTASLPSSVLAIAVKPEEGGRDYRILDRAKLLDMANEYGIEHTGRSDNEIAHAVTMAIIGEYGTEMPEERA